MHLALLAPTFAVFSERHADNHVLQWSKAIKVGVKEGMLLSNASIS